MGIHVKIKARNDTNKSWRLLRRLLKPLVVALSMSASVAVSIVVAQPSPPPKFIVDQGTTQILRLEDQVARLKEREVHRRWLMGLLGAAVFSFGAQSAAIIWMRKRLDRHSEVHRTLALDMKGTASASSVDKIRDEVREDLREHRESIDQVLSSISRHIDQLSSIIEDLRKADRMASVEGQMTEIGNLLQGLIRGAKE